MLRPPRRNIHLTKPNPILASFILIMRKPKTIVIGSGLAGLSAALELSSTGFEVLLLEAAPYIGGRTASWNKDGMEVESGLHRVLGFYTAFPKLVKKPD